MHLTSLFATAVAIILGRKQQPIFFLEVDNVFSATLGRKKLLAGQLLPGHGQYGVGNWEGIMGREQRNIYSYHIEAQGYDRPKHMYRTTPYSQRHEIYALIRGAEGVVKNQST